MCNQTFSKEKSPNNQTVEAMEELENGGGNSFEKANELFKSWISTRFSLNEEEATEEIADLTQALREALPEVGAHLSGKKKLLDAREALKNL